MKFFKIIANFLITVLISTFIWSCGQSNLNDTSGTNAKGTKANSKFRVVLVDAPAQITGLQKVLINIKEVQIGSEEQGWITLSSEPKQYDLLLLTDNMREVIGEGVLPPGAYSEIRLILDSNNVLVINGAEVPLKIPSGGQTGIKLKPETGPFTIDTGKIFEITVDFDANKSIHASGNSGKYILKPVIKIISITQFENETKEVLYNNLQSTSEDKIAAFWDTTTGNPDLILGNMKMSDRSSPEAATTEFLTKYSSVYKELDLNQTLVENKNISDELQITHIQYSQFYNDIPVVGGSLAFHLDSLNNISSINGRYVSGIALNTDPVLTAAEALDIALADSPGGVADGAGVLKIYNERFLSSRGDRANYLVWEVRVIQETLLDYYHWVYYIDAKNGNILSKYNNAESIRNRLTYSSQNNWVLPGVQWFNETGPLPGIVANADGFAAHNNSGAVYDFFFNTFGRDSYNNTGAAIISSVNFGSVGYRNAFWNGKQLAYGDGFAVLDVVAHEITHAVTQYTAGLIYSNQPGALNESFSDVFGVFVDNTNWLMGENTPIGAIRSLANPVLYGQPAHMANYQNVSYDNGGVHINSGIPNKAAYLIITSTSFAKAEQIYYRALLYYISPSAQFRNARNAIIIAAHDLKNAGLYGITNADIINVHNAFKAVGLGSGYTSEGIAGYINTTNVPGSTALHRWFKPGAGDHFYTTDPSGELAPSSGYTYEGITGYLMTSAPPPAERSFYRWYNSSNGDHFYTTDPSGELAPSSGYSYEGMSGYLKSSQVAGTTPLYRWYKPGAGDHFYTTDPSGELAPSSGYTYEGISGYIYSAIQPGTVALYRWFKPGAGDHFYTTDPSGELAPSSGYIYEGITGYILVSVTPAPLLPLFRFYYPVNGDHFYTANPSMEIARQVGYVYEGISGYIHSSLVAGTTPLYRWYNPFIGDHFYTTDPTGELAN